MKNFAIRSFVIALAVVGFSASSISSAAAARATSEAKTVSARPNVVIANMPAPLCSPGGSEGLCNLD